METNYIDTFIMKTAAICNLNCTYCYYFNGVDTSYIGKQKIMDRSIIVQMVDKIISHVTEHNLKNIDITLHGGEPLLMKKDLFKFAMDEIDRIDRVGTDVRRKIQTNGVLIDQDWLKMFSEYKVYLGISLDGPKEVNDQNRVDLSNKGTYDKTIKGLKSALSHTSLHTSVISVINPEYSGSEMYYHLRDLGVTKMDFLLPEGNYENLPFGYQLAKTDTPFADFLIDVFNAWIQEDNPDVTVRILDRMLRSIFGGDAKSDSFGNSPIRVAVIETNGSIEPTDNFKMCEDGMTNMGLSICNNSFNDLLNHEFYQNILIENNVIPKDCEGCNLINKCAGGRLSTRYSKEFQFDKKTVHCSDTFKIFNYIEEYIKIHTQTKAI
ncbi:hypothetical protein COD94_18420 [Bacillus cereus]|nr:hypothetical protein COD94_18420 [Bacillus cereus]